LLNNIRDYFRTAFAQKMVSPIATLAIIDTSIGIGDETFGIVILTDTLSFYKWENYCNFQVFC